MHKEKQKTKVENWWPGNVYHTYYLYLYMYMYMYEFFSQNNIAFILFLPDKSLLMKLTHPSGVYRQSAAVWLYHPAFPVGHYHLAHTCMLTTRRLKFSDNQGGGGGGGVGWGLFDERLIQESPNKLQVEMERTM